MSKTTIDVLRGAAILARQLDLPEMAEDLERHIECLEHQEQVRADRAAMLTYRPPLEDARIYMAPRGTAIGVQYFDEWHEIGYLAEDGFTVRDTRPIPDTWDLYWGDRPHQRYGLPDIDLKATLVDRPRKAGKTTAVRALRDILERNPAAAAERTIPKPASYHWATRCTNCNGAGGRDVQGFNARLACNGCGGTGKRKDQDSRNNTRARMQRRKP